MKRIATILIYLTTGALAGTGISILETNKLFGIMNIILAVSTFFIVILAKGSKPIFFKDED